MKYENIKYLVKGTFGIVRLYQDKLKDNKININEIVDENTNLIMRLTSLNSEIEEEINKLINR